MNPYQMRTDLINQIFTDLVNSSGLDESRFDIQGSKNLLEAFLGNISNNTEIQDKIRKIQKINRAIMDLEIVQVQNNPRPQSSQDWWD